MSTDCVHGCERLNLQHTSRRGGAKRHGPVDHLVRLEEEGRGNGEAQGLGRLLVDHQLESRRLLHGFDLTNRVNRDESTIPLCKPRHN